ncbi:hypothetical protein IFR04_013009 [Cadophora malorum]|uniref:CHAT domain-containing protein n=1 Tax=Cadophora malorum TaxID=108018 RepID=A0A8H7T395_9HELO|nr:hypothetical protein IFR04_013009 [Cadophora malorum]
MSSSLNPADIRGFARRNGGLLDKEFIATCPPDVQPNTRIIGVCGVTDTVGMAAPGEDGWFHSDFWAFHYLLRDSYYKTANQIWLTACSPRYLVGKYKEYLHGPRRGERRVVLDESTLEDHERPNDVRICQPDDLLERFLGTTKSEVEIARRLGQNVLILIFGHGDEDTYGIAIGGDTQINAPRLTRARLESVLNSSVNITLVMTSCFSGGWVMTPKYESRADSRARFNCTFLTGAGAANVSLSWAMSLSAGRRAGGGMLTTCVIHALMTMSEQSRDFVKMWKAYEDRVTKDADGEEIRDNPTFIAMCNAVHAYLQKIDPSLWERHNFSFAAQDDKWDSEWSNRTGFPLLNYRERWEALRIIQPGEEIYPPCDEDEAEQKPGGSLTKREKALIQAKALHYVNIHPGNEDQPEFVTFQRLSHGEEFPESRMREFATVLDYRVNLMNWALDYVAFMNLNWPADVAFKTDGWKADVLRKKKSNNILESSDGRDKWMKYTVIFELVHKSMVFQPPDRVQGASFMKPKDYLAIALVESGLSKQEIQSRLNKLKMIVGVGIMYSAELPAVRAAIQAPEVRTARRKLAEVIKSVGTRLRSLSPSKSPRRKMV